MPSACALRATALAMLPKATSPSVCPSIGAMGMIASRVSAPHLPSRTRLCRMVSFLAQAISIRIAWFDTSSVQKPALLIIITPWSVAALWSMWLKPWLPTIIACAVSISSMTSRGISTPPFKMTSAPLQASIISPCVSTMLTSIS